MDKPGGHYANEISQTERQIPHGIIYMWNLKKKKKLTHKNREKNGCRLQCYS